MPKPPESFEESLDARLRDVAVPDSLGQWFQQQGWQEFSDTAEQTRPQFAASISAAIGEPPELPPPAASAADWTDDQLDAVLRNVPLPDYLTQRLNSLSRRPQVGWYKHAWSASLTVAVCFSYAAAMMFFLLALGNRSTEFAVASLLPDRSTELLTVTEPALFELDAVPGWSPTTASVVFSIPEIDAPNLDEEHPRDDLFAASWRRLPLPHEPSPAGKPPGILARPTAELARLNESGPDWMQRTFARPAVGKAWDVGDGQLQLHRLPWHRGGGVAPPQQDGFDWKFFLRHDEHPFIRLTSTSPSELAMSRVPVDIDRASYDLAWRYLEDGELPPAGTVRKEEYLAAFDYGYPAVSPGQVGLHGYGGPSPYRPGHELLQVGIRVGAESQQQATAAAPPRHLVLVLDVSNSMRRNGRMATVRRALAQYLDDFSPDETWTLLAAGETTQVLVENARRADRGALEAALASLEPSGGTRLAAGIEAGVAIAKAHARLAASVETPGRKAPPVTQLLLIGDQPEFFDFATRYRLEQGWQQAHALGVQVSLIDLTLPSLAKQDAAGSASLAQMAEQAAGVYAPASAALDIHAAVREALTGESPVIGSEAVCSVKFNPALVAAYRLIGHEQSSFLATSPNTAAPAEVISRLRAGQVSTVLYELEWHEEEKKPRARDMVAEVELTWRNRAGRVQKRSVKLDRGSFAAKASESPRPLQFVALVAEAAEVLRHSPYAEVDTMRDVREHANRVKGALDGIPAFAELIEFLDAGMDPRAHRRQRR